MQAVRVSVHLDAADELVVQPGKTVPLHVKVEDSTVFSGGAVLTRPRGQSHPRCPPTPPATTTAPHQPPRHQTQSRRLTPQARRPPDCRAPTHRGHDPRRRHQTETDQTHTKALSYRYWGLTRGCRRRCAVSPRQVDALLPQSLHVEIISRLPSRIKV
jgi:hypothetical protein